MHYNNIMYRIIVVLYYLQLTTPEDVAMERPVRNSPRFVAFTGETQSQYYIIVEQKVLCQVPTFQDALFITFSRFCFSFGLPNFC